ncbi:hypothetical protein HDZ31DRAFT_17525, partial [Schizophyllum fasciatum]
MATSPPLIAPQPVLPADASATVIDHGKPTDDQHGGRSAQPSVAPPAAPAIGQPMTEPLPQPASPPGVLPTENKLQPSFLHASSSPAVPKLNAYEGVPGIVTSSEDDGTRRDAQAGGGPAGGPLSNATIEAVIQAATQSPSPHPHLSQYASQPRNAFSPLPGQSFSPNPSAAPFSPNAAAGGQYKPSPLSLGSWNSDVGSTDAGYSPAPSRGTGAPFSNGIGSNAPNGFGNTSSTFTDGMRAPRDTRTQLFVGNLPYRVRWQDLKDLFRKAGTVLRADVSLGPDGRSRGYGTALLATAEDAGRAIDMFNGYSWQTRVLEVRLDRMGGGVDGAAGGFAPQPIGGYGAPGGMGSSAMGGLGASAAGIGAGAAGLGAGLGGLGAGGLGAGGLGGGSMYNALHPGLGDVRPGSSEGGTGPGRSLFVGNLPFHVQWQDLKDLFRSSGGTILRADVALGADGRSRGFGTVTFASEADAERARALFDGYEFNGRQLKVHYDKFSASAGMLAIPGAQGTYGETLGRGRPIGLGDGRTGGFGDAYGGLGGLGGVGLGSGLGGARGPSRLGGSPLMASSLGDLAYDALGGLLEEESAFRYGIGGGSGTSSASVSRPTSSGVGVGGLGASRLASLGHAASLGASPTSSLGPSPALASVPTLSGTLSHSTSPRLASGPFEGRASLEALRPGSYDSALRPGALSNMGLSSRLGSLDSAPFSSDLLDRANSYEGFPTSVSPNRSVFDSALGQTTSPLQAASPRLSSQAASPRLSSPRPSIPGSQAASPQPASLRLPSTSQPVTRLPSFADAVAGKAEPGASLKRSTSDAHQRGVPPAVVARTLSTEGAGELGGRSMSFTGMGVKSGMMGTGLGGGAESALESATSSRAESPTGAHSLPAPVFPTLSRQPKGALSTGAVPRAGQSSDAPTSDFVDQVLAAGLAGTRLNPSASRKRPGPLPVPSGGGSGEKRGSGSASPAGSSRASSQGDDARSTPPTSRSTSEETKPGLTQQQQQRQPRGPLRRGPQQQQSQLGGRRPMQQNPHHPGPISLPPFSPMYSPYVPM